MKTYTVTLPDDLVENVKQLARDRQTTAPQIVGWMMVLGFLTTRCSRSAYSRAFDQLADDGIAEYRIDIVEKP